MTKPDNPYTPGTDDYDFFDIQTSAVTDSSLEDNSRKIKAVATTFAEAAGIALEAAIAAVLRMIQAEQQLEDELSKKERSMALVACAINQFLDLLTLDSEFSECQTARDCKELREKQKMAERAIVSRLHQHKLKESTWIVQKRTNPCRRERRGRGKKTD